MSRDKEYNARISKIEIFHEELRIIHIEPDEGGVVFTPGQYVEIGLYTSDDESQKIVRRQYSIASTPNEGDSLELFIVLVKDGTLTDPLWNLGVGDKLWMNPKIKGKFTLEPVEKNKNYIFIATGTGLAPFISMLRTYKDSPPWTHVCIVHGVRFAKDLAYDQELKQLAQANDGISYIPCVSRQPEFEGLKGRIPQRIEDGSFEEMLGRELNPQDDQVLICGNPAMIDDLVKLLEIRGFSPHKRKKPGQIHFERYW